MLISRGLSIRYEWEKIGRLAGIYRKLNVHYSTALLARVNQFTSKAFIFFIRHSIKASNANWDFSIIGGIYSYLVTVVLLIR